jgi:hypothetical protein
MNRKGAEEIGSGLSYILVFFVVIVMMAGFVILSGFISISKKADFPGSAGDISEKSLLLEGVRIDGKEVLVFDEVVGFLRIYDQNKVGGKPEWDVTEFERKRIEGMLIWIAEEFGEEVCVGLRAEVGGKPFFNSVVEFNGEIIKKPIREFSTVVRRSNFIQGNSVELGNQKIDLYSYYGNCSDIVSQGGLVVS